MRVLLWSALCLLSTATGVAGSGCVDSSLGVRVCWSHVGERLHFVLQAPSEGWVGLGIPDGGGMAGADIAVVETAPDGKRVVHDYHALQPTAPPIRDVCQDWELISFNSSSGKISAEIARPLVTPDQQDRPIDLAGTMDFIVAHGNTPSVGYHSATRGTIRIPFSGQSAASLAEHFEGDPDVLAYDLRVEGYPIPKYGADGQGTTYADFCFDLSAFDEMHIVGLEQIVAPEMLDYVHHATLNGYETNTVCREIAPDGTQDPAPSIYLWAGHPHTAAFKLPQDVGIPVGGGKALMDKELQGGSSPEEKAHVLTLYSAEDATRLSTALGKLQTGFGDNGTNPVVGPQENCSTGYWNAVCKQPKLGDCFSTCWGKWVGDCEWCEEYTQDFFSCLPCYGKEASLGAWEKDMLMTCNLNTLTIKNGQGKWQPRVLQQRWKDLFYSPLNGGESWQRVNYPVEVHCLRSSTPTMHVLTVADKADLQSRWDAGELEAVAGCSSGQGDCFQTAEGRTGLGYNLLERSGETTWPPSWVDTVQYPLSITLSSPIYRASPKLRQLARYQSLRLNIHYDNRLHHPAMDNSSALRLFLSKTPRKHDAAFFAVGDPLIGGVVGQPSLLPGLSRDSFHCPEFGCRGVWGDTAEVTVFKSELHMHQAGRMMSVEVWRGGDEVVHSDKLDYYDFNWQGQRKTKPWTLKRGDRARVDCVYEVGAGQKVQYGLASSDEMCIWFMGYYPRIRDTSKGTAAICGPAAGGEWGGFCGSDYTNASNRYVLKGAADLDAAHTAMGTPRTFGFAGHACAAAVSPSMQPAPTKSPLPPNSPTQSPLVPSISPSTPSPSVAIPSTPTQSPSTADALRNAGLTEGLSGEDDSSAWWVIVVICAPVFTAACGISVWLFGRKSRQVEFKDNIDEISAVSLSQLYGNLEHKDCRPQEARIISNSEKTPITSMEYQTSPLF